VVYYHVVFTMPSELNGLCLRNLRFMYDTLFDSAWATLQKFAADPKWLGAQTGATMVLHTWGQNLSLHPHSLSRLLSGCTASCRAVDWIRKAAG